MGGSWTRARQCDPPMNEKQPVVCVCTKLQWFPQRGEMDCGLACAQMILRTLDGPGQIPQPVELLAVGEKPLCSDDASSDSSDECVCSLCGASCSSPEDSDVGDSAEEKQQKQSLGAPSAGSSTSALRMRLSQDASSSSDQNACASAGCLCSPLGLENAQDLHKSPCVKERSLFGGPLSPATKGVCQRQARQLAKRVAKGSWTVDLLLFLQHLPCALATSYTGYNPNHADKASLYFVLLNVTYRRISRASLAWEVLNGRVAIVLVDEGRLTAREPTKVPSHQYDGHFVLLCGVAIAISPADVTHASWERELLPPDSVLGYSRSLSEGRKAAGKPLSGSFALTVEAAQRAFAAGLTACQVKAFLILDPMHPEARWLTPDRLDICRTADGTDDDTLFVQMPHPLQNAFLMPSPPACSR
ncbi:hypothetical protein Emed_006662 [Eimeria media]